MAKGRGGGQHPDGGACQPSHHDGSLPHQNDGVRQEQHHDRFYLLSTLGPSVPDEKIGSASLSVQLSVTKDLLCSVP
jgi:hypothetical protein